MLKFKVTYKYLEDDSECTHSIVFDSEYELLGGLSVFLDTERIGSSMEVDIINIETLNS